MCERYLLWLVSWLWLSLWWWVQWEELWYMWVNIAIIRVLCLPNIEVFEILEGKRSPWNNPIKGLIGWLKNKIPLQPLQPPPVIFYVRYWLWCPCGFGINPPRWLLPLTIRLMCIISEVFHTPLIHPSLMYKKRLIKIILQHEIMTIFLCRCSKMW